MSAGPAPLPISDAAPLTLDLPHGPLTYVDEGPRDAHALLAVHGVPGSVRDFRYVAPQLVPRLRVVRIDLPGFGGSAPLDEAIETLTGRARIVREVADRLGLDTFSVLGHSMGGGTALVTASLYPSRVRRLVLVASLALRLHRGLGAGPAVFRAAARGLRIPALRPLLVPWVRAGYRRRRFPGVDEWDARTFELHFRAISAIDFDLLRRCATGPLPPALIAYALDDHMVEPSVSEELARAIPGARVIVFPDGGHNVQKTRAVELGAAIADFCATP